MNQLVHTSMRPPDVTYFGARPTLGAPRNVGKLFSKGSGTTSIHSGAVKVKAGPLLVSRWGVMIHNARKEAADLGLGRLKNIMGEKLKGCRAYDDVGPMTSAVRDFLLCATAVFG